MDGYLTKPVKREDLQTEIEHVTNGPAEVRTERRPDVSDLGDLQDWNLRELMTRVRGDQEFLRELLTIFRQDSLSSLENARDHLANGNLHGLSRSAHTLKGMLRNLAMHKSGEVARQLETTAQEGKARESAELLQQLEEALAELMPEIDAQLAEVKL